MTPLQAIQAATVVNARLLRREGKIGTLKPGAFADLIAVPGDPLADVRVAGAAGVRDEGGGGVPAALTAPRSPQNAAVSEKLESRPAGLM